jgi:hypothetical protein
MNENDSPTPEQVVEAIRQVSAAAGGASPASETLLKEWRESVEQRRIAAEAPSVDNCNDPL